MKSSDIHIGEELHDAPLLRSIKQKEVFMAPEGYFDTLSERVLDRMQDEVPLAESPLLQQTGRKLPFDVPEGYFDSLPDRLRQRCSEEDVPVYSLWSRIKRPGVFLSLAAVLLLLISGVWLLRQQAQAPQKMVVTADDLIALAESGEIDAFTIAAELDLSDLGAGVSSDLTEEDLSDLLDELQLEDISLDEGLLEEVLN